jgi:hypothetical protein
VGKVHGGVESGVYPAYSNSWKNELLIHSLFFSPTLAFQVVHLLWGF